MTPEVISFTIPGDAVAFARAGAKGKRRFTPKPQADYAAIVKIFASRAFAGREPFDGPVSVAIRATYIVPPSWSAKKKAAAFWKTSKPDADNIFKLVADSINGIAYRDDAQIVDLSVQKKYGPAAGVVVSVTEIA